MIKIKYCIFDVNKNYIVVTSYSKWIIDSIFESYKDDTNRYKIETIK